MDRARLLSPSLSVVLHVAGVGAIAAASLLLPDRLPLTHAAGLPTGPMGMDRQVVATLGGGIAGHQRVPPRRVERPAIDLRVPRGVVAPLPPTSSIDVDATPGLVDLPPELQPGGGGGFCLFDCAKTPGPGDGNTAVAPSDEDRSRPVRFRKGGILREPQKLRHVAPVYPALAIAARVEGQVVLDCVIDEEGRVTEVTVLKSIPLLDRAAADAVRQWRYTPTLLNGVPVSVLLGVTVDFRLR